MGERLSSLYANDERRPAGMVVEPKAGWKVIRGEGAALTRSDSWVAYQWEDFAIFVHYDPESGRIVYKELCRSDVSLKDWLP